MQSLSFVKTKDQTGPREKMDEIEDRLAAYEKIFIENVPKEEHAKFYKNLNEEIKKIS